jgi:hypothetical protein
MAITFDNILQENLYTQHDATGIFHEGSSMTLQDSPITYFSYNHSSCV